MKFLVPYYSCLQNPWLGGYRPQIPVLCVLCPPLNLLNPPPPRTKFLGTPLDVSGVDIRTAQCHSVEFDAPARVEAGAVESYAENVRLKRPVIWFGYSSRKKTNIASTMFLWKSISFFGIACDLLITLMACLTLWRRNFFFNFNTSCI